MTINELHDQMIALHQQWLVEANKVLLEALKATPRVERTAYNLAFNAELHGVPVVLEFIGSPGARYALHCHAMFRDYTSDKGYSHPLTEGASLLYFDYRGCYINNYEYSDHGYNDLKHNNTLCAFAENALVFFALNVYDDLRRLREHFAAQPV